MITTLTKTILRLCATLTCHRALHAYLATLYGAGGLHLADKDLLQWAICALYVALALRG